MKLALLGLLAGCALGIGAASADTALMLMNPENLKANKFTLESRPAKDHAVEFVVRRDVRGIDGPGTAGYLSNPKVDGKTLGTPVKLETERDGKILKFRFSVPEDRLTDSQFTLWGQGARGEGVTFRFRLADFPPREKD